VAPRKLEHQLTAQSVNVLNETMTHFENVMFTLGGLV